ncbi:hypothetical protein HXX76_002236 [Chlamydomonas incerta]|uniref:S1 motif domain-containing protein n=1 Tax=Chlamydomonas incerta TaxID=51695 RepID=A0A835WAQ2_CHLIN|nr:hypothetical protein HXX76_002236 [Chlamydomonas incerta]|eukprot:KAG2443896.1 hypothetical protein HXX76_002236 [Chlamydomonas incerta]
MPPARLRTEWAATPGAHGGATAAAPTACGSQTLVDGVVVAPVASGVLVRLTAVDKERVHRLHVRDISCTPMRDWAPAEDLAALFKPGDPVRVLVEKVEPGSGRLLLSTRHLEKEPGDMLRDPQAVYATAEEAAKAWRQLFADGDKVTALVAGLTETGSVLLSTALLERCAGDMLRDPQAVYDGAEAAAAAWRQAQQPPYGVLGGIYGVVTSTAVMDAIEDMKAAALSQDGEPMAYQVGQVMTGVMTSKDPVQGIWIQLGAGGGRALLPPSEISLNDAVPDADKVERFGVGVGEEVRALVLGLEHEAAVAADGSGGGAALRVSTAQIELRKVLSAREITRDPEAAAGGGGATAGGGVDRTAVFKVGDRVRALVRQLWPRDLRITLSTAVLERQPGDMLRDPQAVYDGAAEAAEAWRQALRSSCEGGRNLHVEAEVVSVGPRICWLKLPNGVDGFLRLPDTPSSSRGSQRSQPAGPLVDSAAGGELEQAEAEGGMDSLREETAAVDEAAAAGPEPAVAAEEKDEEEEAAAAGVAELQVGDRLVVRLIAVDDVLGLAPPVPEKELKKAIATLTVGQVVDGTVQSVQPYGAFVQLSAHAGLVGMVHVSEISKKRVFNTSSVFKPGDALRVMVMSVDAERRRVTLSTRALEKAAGDMLTDRQSVYDGAEEAAAEWRLRRASPPETLAEKPQAAKERTGKVRRRRDAEAAEILDAV